MTNRLIEMVKTEYMVSTGSTHRLGDALGLVRQLTDTQGAVTLAKSYQPYGETLSSAGNVSSPFAFAGEQVDVSYLFQAIQDGDSLTIQGEYSESVSVYQDAINSDDLDWWSKERFELQVDAAVNLQAPPFMKSDSSEYPPRRVCVLPYHANSFCSGK